ncbi:MAG: ABC transporter ATP-binding protein [Spirochaetaceae bacterium]|jgi:oligopeptide/dipeptide ABC transporter ATP-binding protein|nr:ABC transporter ATP-binding protein [Spirochaetaceae bacterium]
MEPLLSINNLEVQFYTLEGIHQAVRGLSLTLEKGDTLGLVGESGSGKSVTALSLMRLIPSPPGKILGGRIRFDGRDILALPDEEIRRIRGNEIAMIFQEPMTSLNPIHTCGRQIMEPLHLHLGLSKQEAEERALELMTMVGIPSPKQRLKEYPHQLSGGMRQRVMIAMALACKPKLLIADEPTTALDVTIQAQILELMKELRQEINSAIILITHDLGVVAEMCSHVAVMYAGQIVETCSVAELFKQPRHPYSEGLLFSIPVIAKRSEGAGRNVVRERLFAIEGSVPSPFAMPPGCAFSPRCKYARPDCEGSLPPLLPVGEGHQVRCLFPQAM